MNAYALLIAVDEYRQADVQAVHAALIDPQRGGWPAAKVRLLSGQTVTPAAIRDAFDWLTERLANVVEDQAMVVVYFGGTGRCIDGEYFLPTAKALRPPADLAGWLPASDFATAVHDLPAGRRLLLLDCAPLADAATPSAAASSAVDALPLALFAPRATVAKGWAVLSACQPGERSYRLPEAPLSIFAAQFIAALSEATATASAEIPVLQCLSALQRDVTRRAAEFGLQQTPELLFGDDFQMVWRPEQGILRRIVHDLGPQMSSLKSKTHFEVADRDRFSLGNLNIDSLHAADRRPLPRGLAPDDRDAPSANPLQTARMAESGRRGWTRAKPRQHSLPDSKSTATRGSQTASAVTGAEPTTPADNLSLGFVLDGPQARGLTLSAEGLALLCFKQFFPDEVAGATIDGEKLSAIASGEQKLSICVTPEDGLAIDGLHTRTALFQDGRLRQPVPFALRALAGVSGERGVHVELHHAGARLYEFRLPINVLPVGAVLPDAVPPLAIDLDTSQILSTAGTSQAPLTDTGPTRCFRLKACFEGSQLYLNFEDYLDGELNASIEGFAASIDRARFENLRAKVAQQLDGSLYDTSSAWETFDGVVVPEMSRRLHKVSGQFAYAGGTLFRDLQEDARFKEILDYIDKQGTTGTRLSIVTREVSLPWELLYPQFYDPEAPDDFPLQPELFWGARFALETQLLGEGNYVALLRQRRQATASASLNFNPTITLDSYPLGQVHEQLADTLRNNGQHVESNVQGPRIREVVVKAASQATLIYLFCHGSPPPTAGAPRPERLELDADCAVSVEQLDGRRLFPNAPIIFLNTCSGGSFSSLSFSGFLRAFRRKQALGLIAPLFPVPTCFAARFGADLVTACFQRRGSLASVLREFRQQHLARGNPLPLLYAAQCQVDL